MFTPYGNKKKSFIVEFQTGLGKYYAKSKNVRNSCIYKKNSNYSFLNNFDLWTFAVFVQTDLIDFSLQKSRKRLLYDDDVDEERGNEIEKKRNYSCEIGAKLLKTLTQKKHLK